MADAPITDTDTDDLRLAFTAHIYGFVLGITEWHAERLAVSLIESMRANCPPAEPVLLTWDHAEQPDMDQLAAAVRKLYGGHVHEVDTGDDQYAIVLSTAEVDGQEVDAMYQRHLEGDD